MELLAPAGSFASAVYALQNGADAVYAGLKQFSARNKAVNLSFDELRRLVQFARTSEKGDGGKFKKVYITLNTLIRDNELPKVYSLLYSLAYLSIDGVIIQDIGVLHMIREYFPEIPIHASTQAAAHSVEGVKTLASMGCSRVILSRELTLEEIAHIRKECPETELEVFVHGALCYGFSGMCLASSRLLDRSANRGVCGQICRTWFNFISEDSQHKHISKGDIHLKTPGYFFSMKDLELGRKIAELRRIGIDSIKIEGRMKSPEYSSTVSRYYRSIIDQLELSTANQKRAAPVSEKLDSDIENNKQKLRMLYSRSTTTAWLFYEQEQKTRKETNNKNDRLVSTEYPSHRGVPLGKIISIKGKRITLQLAVKLSLRDGIHYFIEKNPKDTKFKAQSGNRAKNSIVLPEILEARPFALTQIRNKNDLSVTCADPGETVSILSPDPIPKDAQLFKISDHASHLPQIKPTAFPLYKRPLKTKFHFTQEGMRIVSSFSWTEKSKHFEQTYTAVIQNAKVKGKLRGSLEKTFRSSSESLFSMSDCLVIYKKSENSAILKAPGTSIDPEGIFIPPSQLKTIRRKWYQYLDSLFEEQKTPEAYFSLYPSTVSEKKSSGKSDEEFPLVSSEIPLRSSMQFALNTADEHDTENGSETASRTAMQLPFLTRPGDILVKSIPAFKNNYYIPLAPVLFHPEKYKDDLFSLIKKLMDIHNTRGEHIYLGVNNVGHIPIVREASKTFKIQTFVDIYCYSANNLAIKELTSHIAPAFAYYWIEDPHPPSKNLLRSWSSEMVFVDKAFNPPLFISRSCFKRDSLGITCRNCTAEPSKYHLEQNGRRYTVYIEDCISYVFIDA
ncbi:MAG: U32 family peptidase [Spirochaetia bacterium]|nr:U32 family peptidase [Spirochaetia bacterium]